MAPALDAANSELPRNWRYSPTILPHTNGTKERFSRNLAALRLLKRLAAEGRLATPDEQATLAMYSAWGDSGFEPLFRGGEGAKQRGYWYGAEAWREEWEALDAVGLSENEWSAIKHSRLTAYYTPAQLAHAVWGMVERMGIAVWDHLRVLEPTAGTGIFSATAPAWLHAHWTAVEVDPIASDILRHLLPEGEVWRCGLQEVVLAEASFDLVIANVPFGDIRVVDDPMLRPHRYPHLTANLHNWSIAKGIHYLRPGGVMAVITSRYTMDGTTPVAVRFRRWLAEQAELVSAFRLPNVALSTSGTQVIADLLLLRKYAEEDGRAAPERAGWLGTTRVQVGWDGFLLNEYWSSHGENVLGEAATGGLYGRGSYNVVAPQAARAAQQEEEWWQETLSGAIQGVPRQVIQPRTQASPNPATTPHRRTGWSHPDQGRLRLTWYNQIPDGAVVVRPMVAVLGAEEGSEEGGWLVERVDRLGVVQPLVGFSLSQQTRLTGLIQLRAYGRALLAAQVAGEPRATWRWLQDTLNALYVAYVTRYGPLHRAGNRALLSGDPEAAFVLGLERWDRDAEDRASVRVPDKKGGERFQVKERLTASEAEFLKADLFHAQVASPEPYATHADSVAHALLISLNERGRLDWARMGELTGRSVTSLQDESVRVGLVYEEPRGGYVLAEEYLSGNVRQKLREASQVASRHTRFERNVIALQRIQPPLIPPGDIHVTLGSYWVPGEDVSTFVNFLLRTDGFRARYTEALGRWIVEYPARYPLDAVNERQYGTRHFPATDLIETALAGKLPTVHTVDENDRRVVDEAATAAAREKLGLIQQAFTEWLWADGDRAQRITALYNDRFNCLVPRHYNGEHLTLPGITRVMRGKPLRLHPHQRDAIWRILQDGRCLLVHAVGAGKTIVMQAAGMEMRRLELARKILYVVPNDLVGQFTSDFYALYPNARLLVPDEKDFQKANRNELFVRIATGDWDGIIIALSQLALLPLGPETQLRFLEETLEELEAYLLQVGEEDYQTRHLHHSPQKRRTIKQVQKRKATVEADIAALQRRLAERQSGAITWEELGIDFVMVDEADLFKNLGYVTQMDRVKGMPNPNAESQRALDLFMKTQHLLERHRWRGLVFATGTPVSNSLVEVWQMKRYLMLDVLRAMGLHHFDAWVSEFGEVTTSLEQTVAGTYRPTQRLSRFNNLPELSAIFQQVADIRTADELPLHLPRLIGGKRQVVQVPADARLRQGMARIAERVEKLRDVSNPALDNMLAIASDARALSVSERKLDYAAREIYRIWQSTRGQQGAQLVFLDLGTPKPKKRQPAPGLSLADEGAVLVPHGPSSPTMDSELDERLIPTQTPLWVNGRLRHAYQCLREKLVALGMPSHEIRFVHDAKNTAARLRLFEDVNAGRVRVLIGSTGKMGAGMNAQRRLKALHRIDVPWRPRDLIQSEGRILRQGNLYGPVINPDTEEMVDPGEGVEILLYVTEGFDGYVWQAVEAKAAALSAIMRRDVTIRSTSDMDEFVLTAAEAKAIAAGNPLILRRAHLQAEERHLETLHREHHTEQVARRVALVEMPRTLAMLAVREEWLRAVIHYRDQHASQPLVVEGQTYGRGQLAKGRAALDAACERLTKQARCVATGAGWRVWVGKSEPHLYLTPHDARGGGWQLVIEQKAPRKRSKKQGTQQQGNLQETEERAIWRLVVQHLQMLDGELAGLCQRQTRLRQELAMLEAEAESPFSHSARLQELRAEIAAIEATLLAEEKQPHSHGADQPNDEAA